MRGTRLSSAMNGPLLDFGDIEKELAIKLKDGDISAVLIGIDAANRVKKLKLTNCINITGVGLEPLRGSTIIEQIDLSLVGKYHSPQLSSRPPISCKFVVPILDSIIEREGCSLRHLQFPSVWSKGRFLEFEQFCGRYNEMMGRGGIINCAKCNTRLPTESVNWIDDYGIDRSQNYTCYECLKHYCEVCTDDDDKDMLSYYICKDCIASDSNCNKCYKCEEHFCERDCDNQIWASCDSCKKNCCRDCDEEDIWTHNEKNGTDAIQFCDDCDTCYCGKCRAYMCQEKRSHKNCAGCIQLAGPFFLEENQTLRNENKKGKAENETLRDKVSLTQNHNNSLKEQLQYQMEKVKELEEKMKQISIGGKDE
eukprot:scaffold2901_cov91-Skeletonema_dohrnii-CCMP3373.AAC.5